MLGGMVEVALWSIAAWHNGWPLSGIILGGIAWLFVCIISWTVNSAYCWPKMLKFLCTGKVGIGFQSGKTPSSYLYELCCPLSPCARHRPKRFDAPIRLLFNKAERFLSLSVVGLMTPWLRATSQTVPVFNITSCWRLFFGSLSGAPLSRDVEVALYKCWWIGFLVSVFVGRKLMSFWTGEMKVHELYTAACGLYTCWVALRIGLVLYTWIPLGWRAITDKVMEWTLLVSQSSSDITFWLGFISKLVFLPDLHPES